MNKLTLALIIVASVGAIAFFGINEANKARRSQPTISDETDVEREESMRAAFAPSAGGGATTIVSDDPKLQAELRGFFEQLGRAYNLDDREKVFELISGESLLDYCEKSGLIDLSALNIRDRRKFRKDFLRGMKKGLGGNIKANGFSSPRIQRIEKIREGELVAYVRSHGDLFDVSLKMRYWLLKNADGEWQIYDYEDLEQSLRISSLLGALLTPDGGATSWALDFRNLAQALQGLAGDDIEAAFESIGKHANKLLKEKLPGDIEGFTLTMRASASHAENNTAAALADLDRAEELMPSAPGVFYLRGECLRTDQDYAEALVNYLKYTEILGWDSDLHEAAADCHYRLGNLEDSLQHAEKGFAEDPQNMDSFAVLANCIPADRSDEIFDHIKKVEDIELAYEYALDYAIEVDNEVVYKLLFPKFKLALPDSELIDYYEGEDPFGKEARP